MRATRGNRNGHRCSQKNQNSELKDTMTRHRAEGNYRAAEFSVGSSLQTSSITYVRSLDPLLIRWKNIDRSWFSMSWSANCNVLLLRKKNCLWWGCRLAASVVSAHDPAQLTPLLLLTTCSCIVLKIIITVWANERTTYLIHTIFFFFLKPDCGGCVDSGTEAGDSQRNTVNRHVHSEAKRWKTLRSDRSLSLYWHAFIQSISGFVI